MSAMCPGGFSEVMRRNRELCLLGRRTVCEALGVQEPAPASMIASIGTIVLPAQPKDLRARLAQRSSHYGDALQDRLIERWGVQVPIWSPMSPDGSPGPRITRVSAQLYNSPGQYAYFAKALVEELAREGSL
jgi:isopenicillin-N epimerase